MESNMKHNRATGFGVRLTLFGAIFCLAACGQPSGANANQATERSAAEAASAPAPAPAASPTAKIAALPIEQGIYGWTDKGGCARTSLIFFYDGANYGYVNQAEPGANGAGAFSEVNRIVRVAQPTRGSDYYDYYRGYTLVWNTENSEASENDGDILGIKSEGNGRFTEIQVSTGSSGKDMIGQETYQKCSFSQLSPQMQATIRAERPQLASGATASAPSALAPGGGSTLPKGASATARGGLPVKNGLWADDRAGGCSAMKANDPAFILADGRMLFVQDYRNMKPVKDLGGGRFQTGSREDGDLQILHVLSSTHLKIQVGLEGSYSWCSANTRWEPWEFDPSEG